MNSKQSGLVASIYDALLSEAEIRDSTWNFNRADKDTARIPHFDPIRASSVHIAACIALDSVWYFSRSIPGLNVLQNKLKTYNWFVLAMTLVNSCMAGSHYLLHCLGATLTLEQEGQEGQEGRPCSSGSTSR
jgi:hypothetical protein